MIYVRNGKVNASLFQRPACSCALDTTPVGFEPTRGDRIGLAGRRLNHSAKVSHGSGVKRRDQLRPACICALHTTLVGFEPTRGDRIGLASC